MPNSSSTQQEGLKAPKQVAGLWFCPACGMRMAGVTYSIDETRVKCSKTKHKAVAVRHEFVSVSALLSDEFTGAVAKACPPRFCNGAEISPDRATLGSALKVAIEQVGGAK